jgi:hypothetical protein
MDRRSLDGGVGGIGRDLAGGILNETLAVGS